MIEIERLPISDITEQHLQALVTGNAAESQTLEFKRELKIGVDSDKREFCTDVASFANSIGGLILYGVRAENGVAVEVLGLTAGNADDLKLQAEQILHAGISPRLPWKQVEAVTLANGRFVMAVKIQRSHISPHAAGKDGVFRFFTRSTSGKLGMDIPQVRSSFLLSEGLRERLRAFRAERIGRILANDGIAALTPGAKLVIHLVPLMSLAEPTQFNVLPFQDHQNKHLVTPGTDYADVREFNLDGVADVCGRTNEGVANGYAQLFQSGIVEAVDAYVSHRGGHVEYQHSIDTARFLPDLTQALSRYLAILRELGVEIPVYLMVSLTGTRGMAMYMNVRIPAPAKKRCDRDELIFPEIVIADLNAAPSAILRPVFDGLWRAFGVARCPWYDEAGTYTEPR